MQTNIIAVMLAQFPNNATERANFIDKKLYDNNIDPMVISFVSPLTYKVMAGQIEAQGSN